LQAVSANSSDQVPIPICCGALLAVRNMFVRVTEVAVIRSRILHGAAFAAALLVSAGLLIQKAAAATTLTLTWQTSPSSPNIDGYRVYYGTSSGNYTQHSNFPGVGTTATVVAPPAGSTYYYTAVAYKGSVESTHSNELMESTSAVSPTPTPTPLQLRRLRLHRHQHRPQLLRQRQLQHQTRQLRRRLPRRQRNMGRAVIGVPRLRLRPDYLVNSQLRYANRRWRTCCI